MCRQFECHDVITSICRVVIVSDDDREHAGGYMDRAKVSVSASLAKPL